MNIRFRTEHSPAGESASRRRVSPAAVPARTMLALLTATLILPQVASAITIAEIQAEIAALTAQLNQLLAAQGGQPAAAGACTFTRALSQGVSGDDVKCLQQYLNSTGNTVADTGAGSPGNESTYFGAKTKAAVAKWQAANGVSPAAGYFGPLSQAKYSSLVAATPTTPPAPSPTESSGATAPQTPPVATTTPQTTATPAAPQPTAPPPAPSALGLALVSFYGWKTDSMSVQFTHDPGSLTRSYAIYLKNPNQNADIKYGPYLLPPSGETKTAEDGTALKKFGPVSWEWVKPVDFKAEPAGTYAATVAAVGDGDIESQHSPARSATLYSAPTFENLLEGTPARDTQNNNVRMFPITVKIKDGRTDLYYRYTVLDGQIKIWESAYLTNSATPQTAFTNANGYTFVSGKTYRIRAESFDNNTGADSQTKQAPGELAFVFYGQ